MRTLVFCNGFTWLRRVSQGDSTVRKHGVGRGPTASLPLQISQSKSTSVQASKCHDGMSEITEQEKTLAEGLNKATAVQIGQRWPKMVKKESNSVLHTQC